MKTAQQILATLAAAGAALAIAAPASAADTLYNGANADDLVAWTNAMSTRLTIAAGDTVAITNGTFDVSFGNVRAANFGDGSTFAVLKDASILVSASPGPSLRPFGFVLTGFGSCLDVDGGTLRLAVGSSYYPFATSSENATVIVRNGGLMGRRTTDMAGMYTRLQGTNNVLAVLDGGTFDSVTEVGTSDSTYSRTFAIVNAVGCRFAVTNATLKQRNTLRIGTATSRAVGNEVTFHDATIQFATGSGTQNRGKSLSIGALALSNAVTVSGSAGSFGFDAVEIGGTNNLFDIACGTAATFAKPVTLSGSGNTVRLSGYRWANDGWFPKFGAGEDMTLDVPGTLVTVRYDDQFITSGFTFSGTNATVRVRDGGILGSFHTGTGGRHCLKFTPGATKNFTLSVEDGGAVILSNSVNQVYTDSGIRYNWTNCPNSSIAFSGRNPKFMIGASSVYRSIILGTKDEEPLPDAVALVFEIPPEGWAEAPMESLADSEFILYGNQPIVVRESAALAKAKHVRMRVPLIHAVRGFYLEPNNTHSLKAPLDAERVAKLNAAATLPEGAFLRYDAAAMTLFVELPNTRRNATVFTLR